MTTIAIPSPGDEILDTWGEDVANALNALQKISTVMLAADEATNSATPVDITGLSFPVVSGRTYVFRIVGQYGCSATNQGIGIGWRHPGGTCIGIWRIFGPGSASAEVLERITGGTAATDYMTAAATVNAGGTVYQVEGNINFLCTASGTLQFRKQRNGTSGSTGLTLKAGLSVIAVSSAAF